MKSLTTKICAGLILMVGGIAAHAQAPDNTKTNKRDRDNSTVTADQQKETAGDRKITQQIRQAITKDKSLSTYARNVKIITVDGKVSLRGPVRSEQEKQAVEAKATQVAGTGKVSSEIEIAPADDNSSASPPPAETDTTTKPAAPKGKY